MSKLDSRVGLSVSMRAIWAGPACSPFRPCQHCDAFDCSSSSRTLASVFKSVSVACLIKQSLRADRRTCRSLIDLAHASGITGNR